MYTEVKIRPLGKRMEPLAGHALNVSETGIAVELDQRLPIGEAVALTFTIAGMGRLHRDAWPTYTVAAEVVRQAEEEDFPAGPYRLGLRFDRMPTIIQAQIARYVMNAPLQ
jgi:c-di-GMP-binding flagellar brake protein YcgR